MWNFEDNVEFTDKDITDRCTYWLDLISTVANKQAGVNIIIIINGKRKVSEERRIHVTELIKQLQKPYLSGSQESSNSSSVRFLGEPKSLDTNRTGDVNSHLNTSISEALGHMEANSLPMSRCISYLLKEQKSSWPVVTTRTEFNKVLAGFSLTESRARSC
jgi:hypothetical protein